MSIHKDSLSQKISRIKSKIIEIAGQDMAEEYIISGPSGGLRKIRVERGMVGRRTDDIQ